MYEEVKTSVGTSAGNREYFPINIGLHQGLALSLFLFTIVMDEITREIQDEVPWYMLFANDIVHMAQTTDGLNDKLEQLRHTLESRGFLSRSKTEYLKCGFSGVEGGDGEVTMHGVVIPRAAKFNYLGPIIDERGDIDKDINHRIRVRW